MNHAALRDRINQLAVDVGQLRRCLQPDTTAAWRAERIAGHIEALTLMLEPTAAELANQYAPGQDDAIQEAIRIVDARHRSLQQRLGRSG